MDDIVIVSAARTPVGSFNGAFGGGSRACARHRRHPGRDRACRDRGRAMWTR